MKLHGHLLIVDDARENLLVLEAILTSAGHRVEACTSGETALSLAAANPPDLVLLDVNMPGMSGFEVCELLKCQERLRDIPVLFISKLADTDGKLRAFRSGGVDYITKPFDADEVVARVGTHLSISSLQEQLRRSLMDKAALEDLRESLVQMLVHDMRNELGAQRFSLELLKGSPGRDAIGADLEDAISSNETLSRMANDVLDVSRMEAGQMPLEQENVDLGALLQDSVAVVGQRSAGRSTRLTCEAPCGEWQVRCDPMLITRVLGNLLHNALKFSPPGGKVQVSARASETQVTIVVTDDGPGIPPAMRHLVFEKYRQAHGMRQYASSGLGLAFCKMAVEAHGGEIGIEGNEGAGSRFWFTIPRSAP